MVIYNVTLNIDSDIQKDWIQWMKEEHIPRVMDTGFFNDFKMMRMLTESQDETSITYAVQYVLDDLGKLEEYLENHAPKFQKESITRYGTKLAAFRTVLEEV